MLPTPSSSSSASEVAPQLRPELERQIAEKEEQRQGSRGGIGKSVLVHQVSQLKDKLLEVDSQKHGLPMISLSAESPQQTHVTNENDLSPMILEKLHNFGPDVRGSSSSNGNCNGSLLKDKLSTLPSGFDSLLNPSNSTMLSSDSTSLLPLPPPPTGSTPTKRRSKVPNADRKNTDIEFATEIGQGLLIEVRKMQALLQEKEDQLKLLQAQKADMERAAESMAKQLRQREENEERLEEETWNLELAKQELTISVAELQQNLSKANAEQKRMLEQMKKLDADIEYTRDQEQKLSAILKEMKQQHEHDIANLRRHAAGLQRDKADSAKQVEALSSELAIAKAQSRLLGAGAGTNKRLSIHVDLAKKLDDDITTDNQEADLLSSEKQHLQQNDNSSSSSTSRRLNKEIGEQPSETPPPSPKQTSATIERSRELEVESLKTSLAHAHQLVSSLRTNLYREKQEKQEINRFLTEARERIELLENDPPLWVDDYQPTRTKGPDSGGHRRARSKANQKGRVPVSKTQVSMSLGEGAERRSSGSYEEEEEYYDDVDDEESDDAGDALTRVGAAVAAVAAVGAVSAAGFTSLVSELAAKNDRVDPPSNGLRTLGDELSAVDRLQQSRTVSTVAATVAAATGIEAGVQTDDAASSTPTLTTHKLGTQTDHSMQLHELVFELEFENAPDEAHGKETQSDNYIAAGTDIQTVAAVAVDVKSQNKNSLGSIDQSTESLASNVVSEGMQTVDTVNEEMSATATAAAAAHDAHLGGIGVLTDATFGHLTNDSASNHQGENTTINNDPSTDSNLYQNKDPISEKYESTADSAPDFHYNSSMSKMYTQFEMESMIAAAVASALVDAGKTEHHVDENNAIPPRPTSSPPAHLLSRVMHQTDKGKTPMVRVPSNASSTSHSAISEHRASVGSSVYKSASFGNDGRIGMVTQTMIGDWFWKYTHKKFRDGLSDNRHPRYFWVHPYTRTIYWSARHPGSQGSKIKTKSALIEGVTAVEDRNPLPAPDIPAVSILIKTSDGQSIKMTAPTLAHHQVWLESLHYLIGRGESGDSDKMAATVVGCQQQKQQQYPSMSSNYRTEKWPSIHGFLYAFEQSSNSSGGDHHHHDSDNQLEDVRSCCEGKHHVSNLDREHINQPPFSWKRSIRQTQCAGGSGASTSTSVPPTIAPPQK